MGSYPCAQGFNISSQKDIDTSTDDILSCRDGWGLPDATFINSHSPSTDLVFPEGVWAVNITVSDVENGRAVNVSAVRAVETLFLTEYYKGSLDLPSDLPSTVQSVAWANSRREVTYFDWMVNVSGSATKNWKQTNASSILNDFEVLETLYMENSYVALPALKNITTLEVVGDRSITTQLVVPTLDWILGDATFTGRQVTPALSGLQVAGNLIIQQGGNEPGSSDVNHEWNVASIGNDLVISAASNVAFTMPSLTSVTRQLSIHDSINCTFAFPQLTGVETMSMEANVDSPLPGDFRNLEFADSIHLKGHIDTSSSGNIFPSLRLVRDSVIIEAWNADFNCSKLVSQQRQGIIGHLYCNGTDNGNTTTAPLTSSPSGTPGATYSLSRGAWAGIGVGIAVFVLGLIGLVWAILHFRSRVRTLENGKARPGSSALELKDEDPDRAEYQQVNRFPVEMNAHHTPTEMHAPPVPAEMDAHYRPAEMDASRVPIKAQYFSTSRGTMS